MTIKNIIKRINNGYVITHNQLSRVLHANHDLVAYYQKTEYSDEGVADYSIYRLGYPAWIAGSYPCKEKVYVSEA